MKHIQLRGLLLVMLLLNATCLLADTDKPNILFIMVDDLGWHDIGSYGQRDIDTPNLDKLASQGLLFNRAYSSAPVCSPSRAGAITGVSPARIQLTNHISREHFAPDDPVLLNAPTLTALPTEAVTFAEVLKDAGYATGFFGKWHLSIIKPNSPEVEDPSTLPDAQGFEVNYGGGGFGGPPSWFSPYRNPYLEDGPSGEYLADRLANEVIGFMKKNQSKPFLAVMWNYLVHSPLKAPESLTKKYEERKEKGGDVGLPVYAAMIEAMDGSVGKVLAAVDKLGLSNDTLIVFTSDNGGVHGLADNGNLKFGKGWPYEGGIRVPLIVKWPGQISAGKKSDVSVVNTDFFPTFLDVANVKTPTGLPLEGESLLPLFTGEGGLEREEIYFHYPNYAWHAKNRLGGAIIMGDYKLLNWYDDDSVELYNLRKDPYESKDQSSKKPQLSKKLKAKLKTWLRNSNAAMPVKPEQ